MEPLEQVNPSTNGTFQLMLEAKRRGYKIYHYTPDKLALKDNEVFARQSQLSLRRKRTGFLNMEKKNYLIWLKLM